MTTTTTETRTAHDSRFAGAVLDEADADIGTNRDGERVVRLDLTYTRGPAPSQTTMILTLDTAITLRNHLGGLFAAAGVDAGAAVASTPNQDLLEAATATLRLWNKHGLGDDDAESEPVYQALVNAIAKAKGLI